MLRYFFLAIILLGAAIVAVAGFRGEKGTKPPIQIFNDMKWQPRYDAQHESRFYADGRAARPPVPGTVPLGYVSPKSYYTTGANNNAAVEAPGAFSDAPDYFNTGKFGDVYGDGIPSGAGEITPVFIARGQERFNVNCAPCHGATGAGNGIVKQLGLSTVANLHDARIRTMPDGQIFNTITNGKNTMGAYGSNVTVEDRWAIISYLRALQRSQQATPADVPVANRAQFEKTQTPAKQ
ncbi:MAG: cytochrome c [Verrucomicrobiota bacterium]